MMYLIITPYYILLHCLHDSFAMVSSFWNKNTSYYVWQYLLIDYLDVMFFKDIDRTLNIYAQ